MYGITNGGGTPWAGAAFRKKDVENISFKLEKKNGPHEFLLGWELNEMNEQKI